MLTLLNWGLEISIDGGTIVSVPKLSIKISTPVPMEEKATTD